MSKLPPPFRGWLRRRPGRRDGGDAQGRWVVIDTETTGLDPQRDRLLSIGGVAVVDDAIVAGDSFEVILRAEPSGDPANIVVHGIGHEAQTTGAAADKALASFRNWANEAPRVAFHAEFDRIVLRRAFADVGCDDSGARWLDLAALFAALMPAGHRRDARSLDDALRAFGIECAARHNAGADALVTAELLLRLRAIAERQGEHGFDALVRAGRHRRWLGHA